MYDLTNPGTPLIPLFEIFQDITKEVNGILTINGTSENLEEQAQAQESIYRLKIPYKEEEICVEYSVGAQHVARTTVSMESIDKLPEFEITTKSPFVSLFSRSKDRVKIKCADLDLKSKIKSDPCFIELNNLSKSTGFEPYSFGKYKGVFYEMGTEYHLRFPERTKELMPLINFYKSLIDFCS